MTVIDLAAVRAARKASTCTFEIFDGLRRREGSDIVMVGALGDFETVAKLFDLFAEARSASGLDVAVYPAEMALEADGRFWAEAYVTFAAAVALRDHCRAQGMAIQAA